MIWSAFETKIPGKWVLSGEHSVLRGALATNKAIPHRQMSLCLKFYPDSQAQSLKIDPPEATPLLNEILATLHVHPKGYLKIESNIPMGAGLGSSAALCVALVRWLSLPLNLSVSEGIKLAIQLEHRFHKTSSGMDVSVVSAGIPVTFKMSTGVQSLGVQSLPCFSLHDTEMRSRTSFCVLKVEDFHKKYPIKAIDLDKEMNLASEQAAQGLLLYDTSRDTLNNSFKDNQDTAANKIILNQKEQGLKLIQTAMNHARQFKAFTNGS